MTGVLVFDLNETLLDLKALDRHFERIFGDGSVRGRWFELVLRNAMSLTLSGAYHDFVTVAAGSLTIVAAERGTTITGDDRAAIAAAMASLPAHPDVAPNLARLSAHGFRIAALTNSPLNAAERQLAAAGIGDHFDRIMSVEPTRKYKPAPEVYLWAAEELAVPVVELTMVAAHDWDIAGAMAVGWRGAYVARPGMAPNPLFPEPDLVAPDLEHVAEHLIASVP